MTTNFQDYKYLKITTYIIILAVGLVSCECGSSHTESSKHNEQSKERQHRTREESIRATRDFLKKERNSIEAYLKDRDLKMQRSGTGLYYQILKDSSAAEQVESEDVVEYEYDIYLMNGALLYSSGQSGPKSLKVDKEDAVIGVHEALKLLGLGDKGRFVLPSHLAYGVAGDQEKVPPVTPLVYELKVTNIQKSKS